MKIRKITRIISLLLLLTLLLTACSSKETVSGSDGLLDLDYVSTGNEAASEEEADEPWYAWLKRAFSFGSTEVEEMSEDKPDSVAELYQKGTEKLKEQEAVASEEAEAGEEPESGKKPTDSNKKPTNKKDESEEKSDEQEKTPEEEKKPQQEESPEEAAPKGDTVTLTIRCDTAVNNGMHLESKWAGIVPASGCILDVTEFEIEEGDTVFDVLCQARDKYKLHMEYEGVASSIYVQGINNLYEFDGGRWSGWMYCVNDWYPNYGCGVYYLQAGDVIEWNYTCDLGCDLENGDPYGYGKEWKENHD